MLAAERVLAVQREVQLQGVALILQSEPRAQRWNTRQRFAAVLATAGRAQNYWWPFPEGTRIPAGETIRVRWLRMIDTGNTNPRLIDTESERRNDVLLSRFDAAALGPVVNGQQPLYVHAERASRPGSRACSMLR